MDGSVAALEMVEEGQNQPEFPLKRIRFEETGAEEDEDRISRLPDCLLVEILSRLPDTKYAIRTGALSKRLKQIWTSVPNLKFSDGGNRSDDFFSFVNKTLTQRGELKLKKFRVYVSYDSQFETQVRNWIHYAINCEVEELKLLLVTEYEAEFCLDDLFFINSCFTDLALSGCIFDPIGAISWKKLRSLYIEDGCLDEDLIENILSGSPVLETLVLKQCFGYKQLNITSKSVKKLVFYGYAVPEDSLIEELADVIEINAPNILSLAIKDYLLLWKILLVNVSSLVEAELDYTKRGHYETTSKETEEEMLKQFIINLRHVKELKIGINCYMALSRLEAKGFICPSNLKISDDCVYAFDSDDELLMFGDQSNCDSDKSRDGPTDDELQEQVDATTGSIQEDDEGDA